MKLFNKKAWYWLTLRQHKQKGNWFSKGVRATIVTTTRCPMKCSYCPMFIYGDVKKYEESTFEEWKTFIERFPYWISHLYVSGGEPSLYKDIVPLVNWLIERGHHIVVFTNLWKAENFLGIRPHWRLLFMPTYHAEEELRLTHTSDAERYLSAVNVLKNVGFQVSTQQIFQNDHKLTRIKEFFTQHWFKTIDNNIQFPPDAPKSLKMFVGCVEMYRKEESKS